MGKRLITTLLALLAIVAQTEQAKVRAIVRTMFFLIIFYNDSGIFRYFVYATQRN